MQASRHFSLVFVLLMPMALVLVFVALMVKNHNDAMNRELDDEYQRIHTALSRSARVLSAIDYSFSNYAKSNFIWLIDHNKKVVEGTCQMWPIDALLRADGKSNIPAIDINYMLVGDAELCDPQSDMYQRISNQVSLAPVLSFLHDIDEFVLGIHYIDREGYVMSSPDTYAKTITKQLLETLKARPFWQRTSHNRDLITLSGPAQVDITSQAVMGLSMAVFNQDVHQGILSLDIDANTILANHNRLAGEIGLIDSTAAELPLNALRVEQFAFEGIAEPYMVFYMTDWPRELRHFFFQYRNSLAVSGFIYLFLVVILFFINTRHERRYFKQLAAKDPMTGLLNRRGLESYLAMEHTGSYIALAVFDIDNFKSINDTYGHDVGDQVIIYMANKLSACIRNSDAAARIGGEEFVIFMTGSDIEPLKVGLQRVLEAVREDSTQVLELGFTISGGAEIVSGDTHLNFERLFKAADEKLYHAKTHGKNQIVF
ncbi:GGDEF domain-containing protein [Vibrio sinaloensis]|uniref:GGDEF domain-containing protein n=1 Tax=Photobacterium sp. (strain ATCC 43367) TaxID=379097 RepID=UPI00204BA235|nr:GGDEF domain-containing protein [Vibrio sinaloensis]UPQ88791.1 GGDEF domain-containing protein [Vibrio sinaloensis]